MYQSNGIFHLQKPQKFRKICICRGSIDVLWNYRIISKKGFIKSLTNTESLSFDEIFLEIIGLGFGQLNGFETVLDGKILDQQSVEL